MKLIKTKKDPELYYYMNAKGAKMWCYRHRYYDTFGNRKEKSKQGFKTENEAYRELLLVKTSILNGDVKHVENSNLTISEWLDIWFETHKSEWKISSVTQRKNAIKYQMKPLLGKYKLVELDKTTYKRVFVNELLKNYKPGTVQLFHRLFKVAINAAVDSEIIPRNRFNKISIKNDTLKENFLTANELKTFITIAKKIENITNYSLILLLAYTGLRKGEALGLQWNDINFDAHTLTVERTRDEKGVRPPKTKRSFRTIHIDDAIVNQLRAYKRWCKEKKLAYGMRLVDSDFIFISYQSGTPTGSSTLKYAFDRILKEAKGINRITPHGLRHAHATILIGSEKRIPVPTIADRLGNTPQMIHNIYGHSFEELEKESVSAFGEALNM